jgi:hypothetical protein
VAAEALRLAEQDIMAVSARLEAEQADKLLVAQQQAARRGAAAQEVPPHTGPLTHSLGYFFCGAATAHCLRVVNPKAKAAIPGGGVPTPLFSEKSRC